MTTATQHKKHQCPDYGMKHCYEDYDGELVARPENNLRDMRMYRLSLPHDPKEWDDPLVAPLSDVAVAAIIRCHVLMALAHDVDPMLASLAAGMVRASQLLANHRYLVNSETPGNRWVIGTDYGANHWESCVAKLTAGQFTAPKRGGNQYHHLPGDYYELLHYNQKPRNKSISSTVNHYCFPQPKEMAQLRRQGLLVRPSQHQWFSVMRPIAMLMPNGMSPSKMPRLHTRHMNTLNDRDFPLVPALTLSILEYASKVLPMAACCKLRDASGTIRDAVQQMDYERQRYAVWVSGNTDDVPTQMMGFDLAVADMYDSMAPGTLLYRPDRFPSLKFYREWGPDQIPRVKFLMPPWRESVTLSVPNVLAMPKSGIFVDA
jgi:hypothetical protein